MSQTRLYVETDKATAHALMQPFDLAFAEEALPVAFQEDPENENAWTVSIYVPAEEADARRADFIKIGENHGYSLSVSAEELPEIDWVAETLRDLVPVRADRFIVHGSHDLDAPRIHEIALRIDAGLAFGTGHHGTTAGCLEMMAKVMRKQRFRNTLDLGTGSGVLGIAVSKSQRGKVLGTDIDPVATETAKQNVRLNNVHPWMDCCTATGLNHRLITKNKPYDLVVANILAKPLQAMAREIVSVTKRGGTIILSGLLPHQKAALVSRFRSHGTHLKNAHIRDGWLTLVLLNP